MTDNKQLVKRLRYSVYYGFSGHDDRLKAADAIEALEAQVAELKAGYKRKAKGTHMIMRVSPWVVDGERNPS